jgi:hypothetical protein
MNEPALKARGCRWIAVPGAADARGRVNFLEIGKGLDFAPKQSAIMVLASTLYDEADYLRDYAAFKREVMERPA